MPKVKYEHQIGGDGYVVSLEDGDRLGFVRQVARQQWAATDTYFVTAGNHHKTRTAAVRALLRRKAKNEGAA
jgi:hypothetical protein